MPKTKKKKPAEWTSREVLAYWKSTYERFYNKPYKGIYFGAEMSKIKSLLDIYDVFVVLFTMYTAMSCKQAYSVSDFVDNFNEHMADSDDPRMEWYVLEYGKDTQRSLLHRHWELEAKWFPKAKDLKEMVKIENTLEKWIDGINA